MVTIEFEDYTKKGLKSLLQKFDKAGLPVKETVADNKSKRENGYAIKAAMLTFESGQTLVLKIKAGGSLYQAKLNGKVLAIKNYIKPDTFTDEVLAYVKENEPAYAKQKEKQLSRVKVVAPKVKAVNTSTAEQIHTYTASLEEFRGQNGAVQEQIAALQPVVVEKDRNLLRLQAQIEEENNKSTDLQKQLENLKSGIMESANDGQLMETQCPKCGAVMDDCEGGKKCPACGCQIDGTGAILEAAGTAPVQIDRTRIAQDLLHGRARHPKLTAAFVEGFNNSCEINDAIAFIESFTDDELMGFLKEEENIFESVQLKAEGKIANLSKAYFLNWIKAPEETAILEAIDLFNAHQEEQDMPGRAMILEWGSDNDGNPDNGVETGSPAEIVGVPDGRATYAERSESTGWAVFQDTTILSPFTYPAPVVATSGSCGDCPKCGASTEPCEGGYECPSQGCKIDGEGMVMESAEPFGAGTEVTLKGHRAEGDALAGKKVMILESVPTAQGPFYKVQHEGMIYRGIAPAMILEGIGLEIDRSGEHDIDDPLHIDDPEHDQGATTHKPCPWCGADVQEEVCINCHRQYPMAAQDRKTWEAANKPLPANDFPEQYE